MAAKFCGALRGQALPTLGNRPRITTNSRRRARPFDYSWSIRGWNPSFCGALREQALSTLEGKSTREATNNFVLQTYPLREDYWSLSLLSPPMLYNSTHRTKKSGAICPKLLMFTFPSLCSIN